MRASLKDVSCKVHRCFHRTFSVFKCGWGHVCESVRFYLFIRQCLRLSSYVPPLLPVVLSSPLLSCFPSHLLSIIIVIVVVVAGWMHHACRWMGACVQEGRLSYLLFMIFMHRVSFLPVLPHAFFFLQNHGSLHLLACFVILGAHDMYFYDLPLPLGARRTWRTSAPWCTPSPSGARGPTRTSSTSAMNSPTSRRWDFTRMYDIHASTRMYDIHAPGIQCLSHVPTYDKE